MRRLISKFIKTYMLLFPLLIPVSVFLLCFCLIISLPQVLQAEDFGSLDDLRSSASIVANAEEKNVSVSKKEEELTGTSPDTNLNAEDTSFVNRGLSLQRLNPEFSITGDFLYSVSDQSTLDGGKSDFLFRGLGLHFESYLDPYTRLKAAVPVNENGAELGEAYITSFGFGKSLNLTLGKFRQNYGVINRWHKHALDQVDFPLALRQIFGNGGLNQTGLSLDWDLSGYGRITENLSLQITDGDNNSVFGQNESNRPSILGRYSNYRDITNDKYFEFGISFLTGWNNIWNVSGVAEDDELMTTSLAMDFTINNEPADKMRYKNSEWRLEAYYLDKKVLAPDGSGQDNLKAWGFFTSWQQKISRVTELGLRYDYYSPDTKTYDVSGFGNHATNSTDGNQWMISPYVTWYKTPFVHYRMEFNHIDNGSLLEDENKLTFQVVFAAGPHKHERY